MSGPKVSVYQLSATQRKAYYEQLEIIKQTEVCIQKISKSLKKLTLETAKVSSFLESGRNKCALLGKESGLDAYIDQLDELEKTYQSITEEFTQIQSSYRKDKEGFVKLSVEMNQQRSAKLQALQLLSNEINIKIMEIKGIKDEAVKAIEAVDDSLREELQNQMLGGFAVDFSSLRRVSHEINAENAIDDEKQSEELRIKYIEKINGVLSEVADLFDSVSELPADLRQMHLQVKKLASEIKNVDYLENYYAITVTSFAKECKKYAALKEDFNEKYDRYVFLCTEVGIEPDKYECTVDNIKLLTDEIERLERIEQEGISQEYINAELEDAMEQMGYDLIGKREQVKKSGKRVKHNLFRFGEGTGIDLTYSDNGQITMELGGFDTVDRDPDQNETTELIQEMEKFCGEYAALERILENRGISRKNISLMPPSADFAQIFNTVEYDLEKPVSKLEAQKAKKPEIKAKHIE